MKEDTRKKIKENYEQLISIEEDIRRCSNELADATDFYESVTIRKAQDELGKILSMLERILFSKI